MFETTIIHANSFYKTQQKVIKELKAIKTQSKNVF